MTSQDAPAPLVEQNPANIQLLLFYALPVTFRNMVNYINCVINFLCFSGQVQQQFHLPREYRPHSPHRFRTRASPVARLPVRTQSRRVASDEEFVTLPKQLAWNTNFGRDKRESMKLTRWGICFERRNGSWFCNLVRTAVVQVNGLEEQNVALLRYSGGHGFHNFSINRLFVVCNQILIQQLLDLVR